ncbi:hypothetical protein Dvina_41325 [Dactylosporangium vinaceum]|uniref:Uncharacterized protein n=1 Tax=Dactylosporangium vinaceum TaxID=53362 RepID=A0ABV5MP74_9ACTN|nr:hypothetical protein [Dactylosporangium vinaceum]UAB94521.1 hypothetical protein Dvina_41325 [Dactylosporangium vinaceum]
MSDDLTPTDYAFLILLQLENRQLSNTQMDKAHGVRLIGDNFARLNGNGYVESETKSRPYKHKLSEKGKNTLQDRLTAVGEGSDKERQLWAALAALHAHLLDAPRRPQARGGLDQRIRSAYTELATEAGAWVSLTRLRPLFSDVSRADLDAALERLYNTPDIQLEPEANQKTLTVEDRRAAVKIGGEARHLLAIGLR